MTSCLQGPSWKQALTDSRWRRKEDARPRATVSLFSPPSTYPPTPQPPGGCEVTPTPRPPPLLLPDTMFELHSLRERRRKKKSSTSCFQQGGHGGLLHNTKWKKLIGASGHNDYSNNCFLSLSHDCRSKLWPLTPRLLHDTLLAGAEQFNQAVMLHWIAFAVFTLCKYLCKSSSGRRGGSRQRALWENCANC